jgi:hypothetical protein
MDRTNAERQRRYIAKLKAKAATEQTGVSNAELAQLKAENAQLKQELVELGAAANRLRDRVVGFATEARQRMKELEAELARERKRRESHGRR